jgi:hypothetical protein
MKMRLLLSNSVLSVRPYLFLLSISHGEFTEDKYGGFAYLSVHPPLLW